jgi:hypothetical protein
MKKVLPVLALAAAAAFLPSCSTNTQGDDASPIFLEVNSSQALTVNVATESEVDIATMSVQAKLKNPAGGSSSLLDVRLEDYTVDWRRTDGGKAVPQSETFGAGQVISVGGTASYTNFPIMTAAAILRPPLNQLFPFNGGIDTDTGTTTIRTVATVTFHGHTVSGLAVSGNGNIFIEFVYVPLPGKARSK